jgi:hypothetical protein
VELTGYRSEWRHEADGDGRYLRECPGTLYATPTPEGPTP